VELFKQPAFNPIPIEQQVVTLWALQNNYYNDAEVKDVTGAAVALREFFVTRQADLLTRIRTAGKLDDALEAELKQACDTWKSGFVAKG
jgi:F-type H+-transporting ATPase subunit alpha